MRSTRRQALAGAATAGAALALPALARADDKKERSREALTVVLRLEQTALVAYEAIANNGVLKAVLGQFLEHERQHADQLREALDNLGAKPAVPPSRGDIPGLEAALRSRREAARFAIALELRTVAAYQGVIRELVDPNVVRTAAGAMGTDAQQLVVLRDAAGVDSVPRAFETGRPA